MDVTRCGTISRRYVLCIRTTPIAFSWSPARCHMWAGRNIPNSIIPKKKNRNGLNIHEKLQNTSCRDGGDCQTKYKNATPMPANSTATPSHVTNGSKGDGCTPLDNTRSRFKQNIVAAPMTVSATQITCKECLRCNTFNEIIARIETMV